MDKHTNGASLCSFKPGDKVKIKCVGCGANFKRRLVELGLFDGAEVKIIKNDNHCPVILGIMESKIALGQGEAAKISGEAA